MFGFLVCCIFPLQDDPLIEWPKDKYEIDTQAIYGRLIKRHKSSDSIADDGVAIAFEWSRFSQKLKTKDIAQLDGPSLQYFIGYVEGRTRSRLPEWWKKTISSSQIRKDGLLIKRDHHRKPDASGSRTILNSPSGTSASLAKGTLRIEFGESVCELGEKFLDEIKKTVDFTAIDIANVDDKSFVVLFTDDDPNQSVLCKVSKATSLAVWKSKVWGCFRVAGANFHSASMATSPDSVLVYGQSAGTLYIESFNKRTGKCNFRFSTLY